HTLSLHDALPISLVKDFGAGEIETQAADRRRRAVHDFELQERPITSGKLRAPAARRELRPGNGIGRKDGVAAAVDDLFLLAQRLLEVHDLLEGETVHIDEVVLGAMAPHGEGCELAVGDDSWQAAQRAHDVAAAAGRVSQLVAAQESARDGAEGICLARTSDDDDFVHRAGYRPQFEAKAARPSFQYPDSGLDGREVSRRFCAQSVETVFQAVEQRPAPIGRCRAHVAATRLGRNRHPIDRPPRYGIDDLYRYRAAVGKSGSRRQ